MTLVDEVERVYRVTDTGLIAEFSNGCAIAYEMQNDLVYAGLPKGRLTWKSPFASRHVFSCEEGYIAQTGELSEFTRDMSNAITRYVTPLQRSFQSDAKLFSSLAKDVLKMITLETYLKVYWFPYACAAVGIVVLPVTVCIAIGVSSYFFFKGEENASEILKFPFVPVLAPFIFVSHRDFYRTDCAVLCKEPGPGKIAVHFDGALYKSSHHRFDHLDLVMSDDTIISRFGLLGRGHYGNARYYLNIGVDKEKKICSAINVMKESDTVVEDFLRHIKEIDHLEFCQTLEAKLNSVHLLPVS